MFESWTCLNFYSSLNYKIYDQFSNKSVICLHYFQKHRLTKDQFIMKLIFILVICVLSVAAVSAQLLAGGASGSRSTFATGEFGARRGLLGSSVGGGFAAGSRTSGRIGGVGLLG